MSLLGNAIRCPPLAAGEEMRPVKLRTVVRGYQPTKTGGCPQGAWDRRRQGRWSSQLDVESNLQAARHPASPAHLQTSCLSAASTTTSSRSCPSSPPASPPWSSAPLGAAPARRRQPWPRRRRRRQGAAAPRCLCGIPPSMRAWQLRQRLWGMPTCGSACSWVWDTTMPPWSQRSGRR